jgi:SpoVK/Ycf46/Vps4 family AAA+-type ATPase
MSRSDLILKLIEAEKKGSPVQFDRVVEAIIADERSKQHHVLADRLEIALRSGKNGANHGIINLEDPTQGVLFHDLKPERSFSQLILTPESMLLIAEILEEQQRADLLRSYNLEPRNRIMLVGPPGNGKTSVAEAIAEELMLPFLVVRYEGVIGKYLGETALRLRQLFDYARKRRCVLFFDEFDTLGKERGDQHELGEVKRVVSSLLLQIDSLPSYVVVVTATNHPELLDRAVWRRFQVKINMSSPSSDQIAEWVLKFFEFNKVDSSCNLSEIVEQLQGANFSDIEQFGQNVLRRRALSIPSTHIDDIIKTQLERYRVRMQ